MHHLKNFTAYTSKLDTGDIIRNDKEFSSEDLSILIENIMCDLKDLNRNLK